MSNAEAQQQEPSMEEILASIRRIISEDGEEADGQEPEAVAAEGSDRAAPEEEPADDDVLELTEIVDEDGEVVSLADEQEKVVVEEPAAVDEGLELADNIEPDGAEEPDGVEVPAAEPAPEESLQVEDGAADGTEPAGDGLMSEDKADASADAFANLLGAMSAATPVGAEGRTLEDIVKALMRPLLKDWLDANLPHLVDRIVREEIERVVGRARDR